MKKWLLIGGIILVMAVTASPFLIWQLKKPTDLNMLVIDKTVPDQTFREHQGLMWMLNQAKVRKDGKPYKISKDYAGFYPKGDKTYSIKSLPKTNSADMIYITDTYGVYKEDLGV